MASIEIPRQAGAILLPDTVTFPHGALPLYIYEPRYKKMLEDAINSSSMICVANLHSPETSNPADCTADIGIIGLIRVSKKQDDGCSNLILHSVSRVEFLSWEKPPFTDPDSDNPSYPKVNIRPIPNIAEPLTEATEITMASLRDAASRMIAGLPKEVVSKINLTFDKVNEDLAILTDVLAHQFVNDTNVRQSLLEELNPTKRAETLIRYLRLHKINM